MLTVDRWAFGHSVGRFDSIDYGGDGGTGSG